MKCFKRVKGGVCGLLVATISMSSVFAAPLTFTELPSVMDMPSSIRTDVGIIATNDGITVTLNGETIYFPDQQPIILNDRLLVPLRGVLEKMGAKVDWNEKTQTAIFERNGIHGELKLGSKIMKTNVGSFNMDVAPLIYNNRTMIPIRYPVEVLGGTIAYSVNVKDSVAISNPSNTGYNTPVAYGSDASITPTPQPTSQSTPMPLPTSQSTPTPQPTSQSTPTPQPTSQSTPTPQPTSQSTPTPQPISQSTPTPTPALQQTDNAISSFFKQPQSTTNETIVGEWKTPITGFTPEEMKKYSTGDGTWSYTFFDNGTFILSALPGDMKKIDVSGKYTIVGNTVYLTFDTTYSPASYHFTFAKSDNGYDLLYINGMYLARY